jgi:GTP-binding protein HflX
LGEIGADRVPSKIIFNKADRLDAAVLESISRKAAPGQAMVLSAHNPKDIADLRRTIMDFFETSMVDGDLVVPYAKQAYLAEIYDCVRVVSEEYDERGSRLRVRGMPEAVARLQRTLEG